jgi:hypothetical protein
MIRFTAAGANGAPSYVFMGHSGGENRLEGTWLITNECDEGDWYLERAS